MDDYVTCIIEASAALTARVDGALTALGLSASGYRTLAYLRAAEAAGERLTPSWLSGLLVQRTHSVSGLLNRLEDMGLVARDRDRNDRRVVWVSLTPLGRDVFNRAKAVYEGVIDAFGAKGFAVYIDGQRIDDPTSIRLAAIATLGDAHIDRDRAEGLKRTAKVAANV